MIANSPYASRARRFEQEANQLHAENTLLRNECIRLRENLSVLASHIEQAHAGADEPIPEELRNAMDALFPPEARVDAERINKLQELLEVPGSDLLMDRTFGLGYQVTGIETGRGLNLRAAIDELIGKERP